MAIIVPAVSTPSPPPSVTVTDPPRRLVFNDGTLSQTITTVETAQTQIGRSNSRTDGVGSGSATITVDDTARILDPDNTASPLYGHLTPGGTTTAQLQVWNGSGWVALYTGLIESITTTFDNGQKIEVSIALVDPARDLSIHVPPANTTYPMQQSGARIAQMLGAPSRSAWGWVNRAPSGGFALDAGQKMLGPLTTDGTTSTWQYVSDAASAEKGLVFFDPAGVVTYQDQMHRYRSSTPAWVFGDAAGETWVDPGVQLALLNDRVIADVAYATSDGITSGYGRGGAFFWPTNGTVSSTQVSPVQTQLADQMQGLSRATWEYNHYSVNRRDAPNVAVNALGEWPSVTSPSRFGCAISAKIGDYVQLNLRPLTGATITKFYWIDMITHTMAFDYWTTTFTLMAADQITSVWQLGVTPLSSVTAPLPW